MTYRLLLKLSNLTCLLARFQFTALTINFQTFFFSIIVIKRSDNFQKSWISTYSFGNSQDKFYKNFKKLFHRYNYVLFLAFSQVDFSVFIEMAYVDLLIKALHRTVIDIYPPLGNQAS